MPDVVVRAVPGGDEPVARRLEQRVAVRRGHEALGGAVWLDLADPQPGSVGLVAEAQGTDPVGYAHVARSDSFAPRHWVSGLVVDPDAPATRAVVVALLERAREHVAAHGGGTAVVWWTAPDDDDRQRLAEAGFAPDRAVLQLRVPLPLAERPVWPPGVRVRDFEPGRDEAAWLDVNNRAFAQHPDQGDWVASTLERRMAEPWFDPGLFVLAEDAEGLVGFDWCKVHPGERGEPTIGEIFVIGVHPRAQGLGVGRALAIEGLDRLAGRGIATGSLFVAADNHEARRLYRSLGFGEHRRDEAFVAEVPAA